MKVLVFDFDGVLANSQFECLFVGFNAYLKLNKNTSIFDAKKVTFDNFNRLKKEHKKTIDKYKKLRPYVIDAFCWYVILHIIEKNIKIKNQNQYSKIREKLMRNKYKKYVNYFYYERYKLQKKDFKKWLKLEVPYKKTINAIKKLGKKYIIAIATNNNKKSIRGFLKKYKINTKIIADSDTSIDKGEQLKHIKDKLKIDFDEIHFVDDQVKYFSKLLKLGIKCYIAMWGYNNKEQQKEARQRGVIMLNENNFYKELVKS